MPIAAPLLVPFAELVGITTAGLALSQVSDAVQSYMKANPEQSMKILTMLSPELGIASMMKKKTKKKPEVQEEEVEKEPRLTAEEKREKFIELSKKRGRGRQDFIDLAQDLGLAKKGSEEQPPEDDEEEQILTGAQKTQLFKNLFREGGAKNIDYARLGRATKRGNQGLYQEGLEALKKTLKGKKDGGRIGYAIGGLTDRAQGIYNSMLAANFDDQTIIDTLNQLGIYNQDTPVVTTPEVVNTQPNIIGQQVNYGGNDMPLSTGSTTDLTSNFKTSTQERQNRLTNPNKVQSFVNKFTGGGQPDIGEMIRTGQVDTRASAGIPLGVGALIGRALPDKYYDMSLGDQVFTQSQMGYTGPTVFGENTVGNYKDPFGLNVRSAFGNYSEAVGESFNTLRDALTGRLSDKYGAEFDEELGMFTGTNADLANQMTKMMRNKFKFRTEQLAAKNRLDAQIKAAEEKRKAEAAKKIIEEEAAKKAQYGATNYGIGSDGQQSYSGDAIGAPGLGFGIGATTGGPVSNRTGKGRTGYQAGGVATPEQYAAALAKVGGGTEADKRRSLGNYLGDYIATQGQKIGNAAIIPFQAAKGVLGIQGTPMTPSMQSALQNIIQNQIKNTGKLSGNINYNDYGVKTTTGAEFEGFGNRSITDPEAALATTLGRASYSVDPQTGKVNFTGGTAYDFRDDQFGGLGKFISKGGLFNQLPSPSNNFKPGATEYNPNISLSSDFLKPYQTTPSIDQSGVIPGFTKLRSQYYNPDGTLNQEKFKAANFVAGMTPNEFEYKDTRTGDIYGPSTYASIAAGMYPNIYKPGMANGGLATMFSEKR